MPTRIAIDMPTELTPVNSKLESNTWVGYVFATQKHGWTMFWKSPNDFKNETSTSMTLNPNPKP